MPTYYITTLNIAIPLFVSLILFEILYAKIIDKGYVIRSMDTLSSLCSGLTNVIRDVLGLTIVIISYSYMVENFAIFKIETSWLLYLIAFIGLDFAGYWVHRINHSVNYFWNHHIIHHSSEEFNLACALRQSISNFFSLTFIFLIPTNSLAYEETFFGPFFEFKKDSGSKVYAFRPLVYYEANYELKYRSLDILYPFIGYQEDNQRNQFQAFFYLIKYKNFNDYDNLQEKNFSIFPILDISWSGKKENDYFSFFPIYGNLKNKFTKDEINYLFFPLYLNFIIRFKNFI